ncbi:hypothetical protein AB1M95_18715 [Sulfitobacter sp. LCG007]
MSVTAIRVARLPHGRQFCFRLITAGQISPPSQTMENDVDVSVENLQRARKAMIRIVQARPDGRDFVPFVLRLERQIAANANIDTELARIMMESS